MQADDRVDGQPSVRSGRIGAQGSSFPLTRADARLRGAPWTLKVVGEQHEDDLCGATHSPQSIRFPLAYPPVLPVPGVPGRAAAPKRKARITPARIAAIPAMESGDIEFPRTK